MNRTTIHSLAFQLIGMCQNIKKTLTCLEMTSTKNILMPVASGHLSELQNFFRVDYKLSPVIWTKMKSLGLHQN